MSESFNHTIYQWLYLSDDGTFYNVGLSKAQGFGGVFLIAAQEGKRWGRNCKSNHMRSITGKGRVKEDIVTCSFGDPGWWQYLVDLGAFGYTKNGYTDIYDIVSARGEFRANRALPPA